MNQNSPIEDSGLDLPIKMAGQAYSLSDNRAHLIVSRLNSPAPGRPIISSYMNQINIFMSTTAKFGLVALVLVLVSVFGFTQLGSRPSNTSVAVNQMPVSDALVATKEMAVVEKGNGNVDDTVGAIVTSTASEDLLLAEESADASYVTADSQELSDFSQSINDNDF